RAALRAWAPGAAVVHLAAHAQYRHDNPLLSSLEMADGRLTLYDLLDLDLGGALVVLSGCRTGWTAGGSGMELLGLSGGFHRAGATALVASLWPVEDEETARFMASFYEGLGSGSPRAALAGAMRLRIGAGALPHEWAPFHLSGRAGSSPIKGGTSSP
ncbi:MAG: CHAT domain-containing protein, partial [Gemmatimonadota bacterium]